MNPAQNTSSDFGTTTLLAGKRHYVNTHRLRIVIVINFNIVTKNIFLTLNALQNIGIHVSEFQRNISFSRFVFRFSRKVNRSKFMLNLQYSLSLSNITITTTNTAIIFLRWKISLGYVLCFTPLHSLFIQYSLELVEHSFIVAWWFLIFRMESSARILNSLGFNASVVQSNVKNGA